MTSLSLSAFGMPSRNVHPSHQPPLSPGLELPPGPSILLNRHDAPASPSLQPRRGSIGVGAVGPLGRVTAASISAVTASTPAPAPKPIPIVVPTTKFPDEQSPTEVTTPPASSSPRIRFAPLPDPHKPRSLSTGHNLALEPREGANGEREYTLELQNMGDDGEYEQALDDDDDDDDDGADYDYGRRKSWVTMGMGGWASGTKKGTKKLLGLKPENDGYGAPLRKSVSQGGTTNSSPFRWTGEVDRRKSTSGTSPTTSTFLGLSGGRRGSTASAASSAAHRRGSSADGGGAPRGPAKVKMMNGRVYGARRASEAAAAEEARMKKMEPAFVEWSGGGKGGGVGSAPVRGPTVDDDDGGGMAWVRRRREERERREREEREAAELAANDPNADDVGPKGEALDVGQLGDTLPAASPSMRPASLSDSSSTSSARNAPAPVTPNAPAAEFEGFSGPVPAIQIQGPTDKEPAAAGPGAVGHDSQDHIHAVVVPDVEDDPDYYDDDGEDNGDFEDDADDDDDDDYDPSQNVYAQHPDIEVVSHHK